MGTGGEQERGPEDNNNNTTVNKITMASDINNDGTAVATTRIIESTKHNLVECACMRVYVHAGATGGLQLHQHRGPWRNPRKQRAKAEKYYHSYVSCVPNLCPIHKYSIGKKYSILNQPKPNKQKVSKAFVLVIPQVCVKNLQKLEQAQSQFLLHFVVILQIPSNWMCRGMSKSGARTAQQSVTFHPALRIAGLLLRITYKIN